MMSIAEQPGGGKTVCLHNASWTTYEALRKGRKQS
jgi:hypothetical protein